MKCILVQHFSAQLKTLDAVEPCTFENKSAHVEYMYGCLYLIRSQTRCNHRHGNI